MDYPLLALTEPSPPGFAFRRELSRAELRRTAFALYAGSLAEIDAALAPFHRSMAGILVTPADELRWERHTEGLYHLGLPPALQNFLPALLRPHLELLATSLQLHEQHRELALNLARAAEDRTRLVREFGEMRRSLLKEIGDRRAAEAELQKAHDELELRVEQRTAELARANGALEIEVGERRRVEQEVRETNSRLEQVLADLTHSHEELKRAQLQLIQAEKMQSVGNLAAGVAHEVKNPLAILEMGVGCLRRRSDLDPDSLQVVLNEMTEAVSRANTVISGLLDYASSKELAIREADLHAVLDNSLRLMKHELVNNKINVVRKFGPDLPQVRIDALKIEQVFINLFTNACHAMPNGGTLTVATGARSLRAGEVQWEAGDRSGTRFREDERVVVVTIQDTGTGIPDDQIGKIFDPFFTTKPTGKGTGLGLTVARKIVALHAGRLEIANIPNGGAAATVTFKLK